MQCKTGASAGQAAARPAGNGSSSQTKLPGAKGKGWGGEEAQIAKKKVRATVNARTACSYADLHWWRTMPANAGLPRMASSKA